MIIRFSRVFHIVKKERRRKQLGLRSLKEALEQESRTLITGLGLSKDSKSNSGGSFVQLSYKMRDQSSLKKVKKLVENEKMEDERIIL